MWKNIGAVNSPDNKSNRSRQESNMEPFGQASRLRLNQSQLSGDNAPRFLEHYFSQKRSSNSLSQKNLVQNKASAVKAQYQPFSYKQGRKDISNKSLERQIMKTDRSINIKEQAKNKPISSQKSIQIQFEPIEKNELKQQLNKIKKDQINLVKIVQKQMSSFRKDLKSIQQQFYEKIKQMGQQNLVYKQKPNLNPEILSKLKQENMRFNERIQLIENKKSEIKQKYKLKLDQL